MMEQIPKVIIGLGSIIGIILAVNAYRIRRDYERSKKQKEG
jgi:hypothetical protein